MEANKYRHRNITMLFINVVLSLFYASAIVAQDVEGDVIIFDIFPEMYKTLPTNVSNNFEFPFNKKFTIQLVTEDSIHYNYRVIEFERQNKAINYSELSKYFKTKPETNDILELFFCIGVDGDNPPLGKQQAKNVLVVKNWTDLDLTFDMGIQKNIHSKKFLPVIRSTVANGAITLETWEAMLNDIRLSNFRIQSNN